jgi:hypothetical protein
LIHYRALAWLSTTLYCAAAVLLLSGECQAATPDDSGKGKPSRQKEYQVILRPERFSSRAAGVKKFLNYLQQVEDDLKQDGKKTFRYIKDTGENEKREAIFFDTTDGSFKKAHYAVRYRRVLEEWVPNASDWMKPKNARGELTIKHNADQEALALGAELTPADDYRGKWDAKIEQDLYQPEFKKYGYSVTLYGKRFRKSIDSPARLKDVASLAKLFPKFTKSQELSDQAVPLVRQPEYRWSRDEIQLAMGEKMQCKGTLSLVYDTRGTMDAGNSAPRKIEFSWRLKQGQPNWKARATKVSEVVRKHLWNGKWAVETP